MAAVGPGKTSAGRGADPPGRARRPTRGRSGCSRGAAPTRWRRRCCTRARRRRRPSSRRSSRSCASTRSPIRTMPGRGCAASFRRCTTSRCRRRPTAISTTYATWTGISGDRFYKNAPGADFTTFTDAWVNANIRSKGPLGKLYPVPCCIHEGDTPSFLGLIDNGLASSMSPTYGGWGGRYVWRTSTASRVRSGRRAAIRFRAATTRGTRSPAPTARTYTSDQATIWRWRTAFQHDFAARMDWTIKDPSRRESQPGGRRERPGGQGAAADRRDSRRAGDARRRRHARSRRPRAEVQLVLLSRSRHRHPGSAGVVAVAWCRSAGEGLPAKAAFLRPGRRAARASAASHASERGCRARDRGPHVAGTAHIILAVEDDGSPTLTSYRRVILTIKAK